MRTNAVGFWESHRAIEKRREEVEGCIFLCHGRCERQSMQGGAAWKDDGPIGQHVD